jgi:hypothetical protein
MWLEGLGKLKQFIDLIGTGTHDLPACSIVSEPTTLARSTYSKKSKEKCSVGMYVCMHTYMQGGWGGKIHPALALWLLKICCASPSCLPSSNHTLLIKRRTFLMGHHDNQLVPWNNDQCDEILRKLLSLDHIVCVWLSSFSRHLLHMGLFINPSLKRCPFRTENRKRDHKEL